VVVLDVFVVFLNGGCGPRGRFRVLGFGSFGRNSRFLVATLLGMRRDRYGRENGRKGQCGPVRLGRMDGRGRPSPRGGGGLSVLSLCTSKIFILRCDETLL